jgi:hypothetical protein
MDSFIGCSNACAQGDQNCLSGCANAHMAGYMKYQALVLCAVCQECPVDCDAAGSGCPSN